jgi:membrane protein YqaA with SNARE-associated domain
MDWLEWGYMGLFIASFLSATVVPFSSEAVLAGILLKGGDPVLSIGIATLGNTLGGMTSFLDRTFGQMGMDRTLPAGKQREGDGMAATKLARYGSLFAVLSFVPIIGDAIPLASWILSFTNVWLTCFC